MSALFLNMKSDIHAVSEHETHIQVTLYCIYGADIESEGHIGDAQQ